MSFHRLREQAIRGFNRLRGKTAEGEAEGEAEGQLLAELPQAQWQSILEKLESLPLPPVLAEGVKTAIDDAIAPWRSNTPNARNSLAILGNPVDDIARIVTPLVEQRQPEPELSLRVLHWSERPEELHLLENRLIAQLGRGLPLGSDKIREIVVIPNLSWCFLRSADGLEGIEYLRDAIATQRDRFWILGCSKLAWHYLNLIAKIAAYAPEPYILPQLDGEQLQTWLTPIVETLGVNFNREQKVIQKDLKEHQDSRQKYFQQLAEQAEGSSSIALNLFARSLRLPPADSDLPPGTMPLFAESPRLPDLPELSSDGQYLLYSLLLHHRLNLTHLAESLGDNEANVQAELQGFRGSGIVEQLNSLLEVNPLYYRQLQEKLNSNHFLMSDE